MLAASLLVPREPEPRPGFASVTAPIELGLPASFALDGGISLMLLFPTGDLRRWQRADPDGILTDGSEDRAPLRLALVAGGRPSAIVPLVRERRLLLGKPDLTQVELVVTGWRVLIGDLVGPGRRGGFLAFSWRRLGNEQSRFVAPMARPDVLARLRIPGGSTPVVGSAHGGLEWRRRHGTR